MEDENGGAGFSPFDAPIKDAKKPGSTDNVKMEQISEAEATGQNQEAGEFNEGGEGAGAQEGDGNPPQAQPLDAPAFQPPNFAEVPGMPPPTGGPEPEDPTSDEPSGGGGGKDKDESTKVPEGFSKEFSDYTAQWLVDIYFKLFLGAIRNYCKIDKTEVLRAVNKGIIHQKFVKFIENINDKVDSDLDVTDEEKQFVIEPLQQFIVMKKIAIKPEYLMLGSLIMVSGTIFLRAQELKEQNKIILDTILKESAEIKRGGGGGGESAAEAMAPEPPKDPINVETFTAAEVIQEEEATGDSENHI